MTESLRILLVNHGLAAEMMGGDGVQIEATAAGLRHRNHQVRVAYSNKPDTTGVDLVHIFNARTDQALAGQLAAARLANLPVDFPDPGALGITGSTRCAGEAPARSNHWRAPFEAADRTHARCDL
jgi:hypothetical protein